VLVAVDMSEAAFLAAAAAAWPPALVDVEEEAAPEPPLTFAVGGTKGFAAADREEPLPSLPSEAEGLGLPAAAVLLDADFLESRCGGGAGLGLSCKGG